MYLDTMHSPAPQRHNNINTQTKTKTTSPTKKYRTLLARQRKRVQRLRQALNKKKKRDISRKAALEVLQTVLPERIVKFIEVQMHLHTRKNGGKRYTPEMKYFAISLYHVSGKAYRLVSKFFNLPSKSSLLRWVSGLPISPGMSQQALDAIESKVKCMSDAGKLCTISMDEISLKTSLLYDSTRDEVVGVEDFGNGHRTNRLATAAVVFMARGITSNWKQPLGYYLVHESCPSSILKTKLFEIIGQITSIGLQVRAIISDLGSNFQKLLREMNITPTAPWFMYNGRKIFYLFDPPHLIKAVRNNLINYDFHYGHKIAQWNDILTMYERDKSLAIRCCPKLTDKHVHLIGFTKMKVKYATQILSHSVSATIFTYVSLGALPSTGASTAELVANFDKIFDCLNSSTLNSPKQHRRPISDKSVHHEFLSDMLSFIKSIKVVDRATQQDHTNNLKCLNGLCLTITGVLSLWKMLHEEDSIDFLLTRRLNQDHLENFFGSIRQQGGNSDNPTPLQFTRAFRKLFYDHCLVLSSGNCTEDLDAILLAGSNFQKASKPPERDVTEGPAAAPMEVDVTDYKSCLEGNIIGMNAVTYVTGYLLKKCFLKHSCDICQNALTKQELNSSTQLLCLFKAYEETKEKPFGGLISPSDAFLDHVLGLEAKFVIEFENNVSKLEIGKYLLSKLPTFSLLGCPSFPSLYLLRLFVRMRIHYALNLVTEHCTLQRRKIENI